MQFARKLILLAVLGAATLAVTAAAASAQIEVTQEVIDNYHCPELFQGFEHVVTGGCIVEFDSTGDVELYANVPGIGVVQLSNCKMLTEATVAEDGTGYIVGTTFLGPPPPGFPCTRTACDEAAPDHQELLWPLSFEENGGGESLEMTLCLRPSANAEGAGHMPCTVHLDVTDLGAHEMRIGEFGSIQAHCEPGLPFDVWLTNAEFRYGGATRIELAH